MYVAVQHVKLFYSNLQVYNVTLLQQTKWFCYFMAEVKLPIVMCFKIETDLPPALFVQPASSDANHRESETKGPLSLNHHDA